MMAKANLFRKLVVVTVVVAGVAVALFGVGLRTAETQTTAPTYYKVEDLGTLGGSRSGASAINDSGEVVGYSYLAGDQNKHAFLYKDGKMTDLGTLGGTSSEAKGINKSGQVVGWSDNSSGERRAFIYDSTNGMKDLNDLIPAGLGWSIDEATAINNNGQIAATGWPTSWRDPCSPYAETWDFHTALVLRPATTTGTTATYEMQNLGTLGGDYSYATGINDSGKVVGRSSLSGCGERPFLYDENANPKMQDLPGWEAYGISNSGKVVGYTWYFAEYDMDCTNNDCHRAFIYDSATKQMQVLGTLGTGDTYGTIGSEAYGINDSDKVVGLSGIGDGFHHWVSGSGPAYGFIYDSTNGMRDLNSLIPADSGWTIHEATAINNNGQIAATGYKEGVGQHALLLSPTNGSPPPDDTQAPSPPSITSPQNNSYDTDGSFSVSGSAEAGSTVELFEGTASKGTTKADSSSGAWSISLSGLSEGAHTYTAKATDAAGNTSTTSSSVTVTVDKSAPKVDSVIPKEDVTGVDRTTNVTATFSEKMRDTSIYGTTFKLFKKGSTTKISATVSYDPNTRTATLNPFGSTTTRLARGTTYKAVVTTGATDMAGNQLDQDPTLAGLQQKAWFFTTTT